MRAQRGPKKFARHYFAVKPGDLINLKNPLKQVNKAKFKLNLLQAKMITFVEPPVEKPKTFMAKYSLDCCDECVNGDFDACLKYNKDVRIIEYREELALDHIAPQDGPEKSADANDDTDYEGCYDGHDETDEENGDQDCVYGDQESEDQFDTSVDALFTLDEDELNRHISNIPTISSIDPVQRICQTCVSNLSPITAEITFTQGELLRQTQLLTDDMRPTEMYTTDTITKYIKLLQLLNPSENVALMNNTDTMILQAAQVNCSDEKLSNTFLACLEGSNFDFKANVIFCPVLCVPQAMNKSVWFEDNNTSGHFIAIVIDFNQTKFYVLDPLGEGSSYQSSNLKHHLDTFAKCIIRNLKTKRDNGIGNNFTSERIISYEQPNGTACGPLLLLYAELVAIDGDCNTLKSINPDEGFVNGLRLHHALCLADNKLLNRLYVVRDLAPRQKL